MEAYYNREKQIMYSRGLKRGCIEGVQLQKAIFNKKIDNKIAKIMQLKEDFKIYIINSKTRQEKEYWISEIAILIKQQRLLKELKEEN